MKVFRMEDLNYRGLKDGVHSWDHPEAPDPYYWHPDWLHIAEDALGLHPKQQIDVNSRQQATKDDAEKAIIQHLEDSQK